MQLSNFLTIKALFILISSQLISIKKFDTTNADNDKNSEILNANPKINERFNTIINILKLWESFKINIATKKFVLVMFFLN